MMAISWLIFCCLPVVPALVLVTKCILCVLFRGYNFFFLELLTSRVAECVPADYSALANAYYVFQETFDVNVQF